MKKIAGIFAAVLFFAVLSVSCSKSVAGNKYTVIINGEQGIFDFDNTDRVTITAAVNGEQNTGSYAYDAASDIVIVDIDDFGVPISFPKEFFDGKITFEQVLARQQSINQGAPAVMSEALEQ